MIAALALSAALLSATPPSDQTVVFYNARSALRENKPNEVLKLWLLRNVLTQRGEPSEHDADFRSVVWAALGRTALCQDGLGEDVDGAGLWPLALHNYLVSSLSKGPPVDQPAPWDAFDAKRQQRFVSLNDVLSAEELRSVAFFRSKCVRPQRAALAMKEKRWLDTEDRLSVGLLMRDLLEQAKTTVVAGKFESTAVIDARIFDLDLALTELMARKSRREGRQVASEARAVGVSAEAAAEMRKAVPTWPKDSAQAQFLRDSLKWRPVDWLSLSPSRRLFLFAQARQQAAPGEAVALNVGIIDGLIEQGRGDEIAEWIGFLEDGAHQEVTAGERGQRLLLLEPEKTGFKERSVIALHRGVQFLEAGERQEALRAFAFAMQRSEESKLAEETRALSRRWLSYVLSQFETTPEVIATLKALVPKQDYNSVVEELVWRAALRADKASFARVSASVQPGSALDGRIQLLQFLADGKPGELATQLRARVKDEPHAVLTFLDSLLDGLEVENAEVRRANVVTVKRTQELLALLSEGSEKKSSQARQAAVLAGRAQAILDGLDELDASEEGRARSMSLSRETHAGAIRLAPADPLPWPFKAPTPSPPSAFSQLLLLPVEWREANGELVFGWRLTE